ncbi:MAG: mannose-1-phosphate guanylyltransferase/mannose-6-phosphate isomerase [Proteobacteria bacterium]|nr:mannose-1-phosphate guanylyltransferase/mannose-6-phosphate isomerase [Pseudomonadota bacterium]
MASFAFVPLILSGGAGTRLWPLSREATPKPFIPLPDGETLLARTARRALAVDGAGPLITVTNRDYYFATKDVYTALDGGSPPDARYLLEPFGRNTAGAVTLGALAVAEWCGDDMPLLVLPADHLIRREAAFARAALRAVDVARSGRLVTFGIAPTHPDTGFGYIRCGDAIDGAAPPARRVQRFIEKPPRDDAVRYVMEGGHLWNSGMFALTPRALLAALARHAPDVLDAARRVHAARTSPDGPMSEYDAALFALMPDISIDYAVMERVDDAVVVEGEFDWSDVGSWQAVSELSPADAAGNRGRGERVSIATSGTYVHADERVVATVGVDNLVIVDTPDAVLVAHRDHLQRVKDVVAELKARGHDAYKLHRTVARPWGTYTVLQEAPGYKIKRIEVKSGATLSLQMHHRRSEHWVVVSGSARVTRGDDVFDLAPNESAYIPVGMRHRLANVGSAPLAIIEVQCGEYVGEDDIVRFDDVYGRVV